MNRKLHKLQANFPLLKEKNQRHKKKLKMLVKRERKLMLLLRNTSLKNLLKSSTPDLKPILRKPLTISLLLSNPS
jgi:hypothetical protein